MKKSDKNFLLFSVIGGSLLYLWMTDKKQQQAEAVAGLGAFRLTSSGGRYVPYGVPSPSSFGAGAIKSHRPVVRPGLRYGR